MDLGAQELSWYLEWMWSDQSWSKRKVHLKLEEGWNATSRDILDFFQQSNHLIQFELLCKLLEKQDESSRPSPLSPAFRNNATLDGSPSELPNLARFRSSLYPECAYKNVLFLSGDIIHGITSRYPLEREYQYRCLFASLISLRACDVESLINEAKKTLSTNISHRHSDLHKIALTHERQSTTLTREFKNAQTDALAFGISEFAKRVPNSQKLRYSLIERAGNIISVVLSVTSAVTGASAVSVLFTMKELQNAFKPLIPKSDKAADTVFTVFHATLVANALYLLATVLEHSENHTQQSRTYFNGAAVLALFIIRNIADQLKAHEESSKSQPLQPHSRIRSSSLNSINRTSSFNDFYKVWLLLDCAIELKGSVRELKEETKEFDELISRIAVETSSLPLLRLKALQYLLTAIAPKERETQIESLLSRALNVQRHKESVKEEIKVINEHLPRDDKFDTESLFDRIRRPSSSLHEKLKLQPASWMEEPFQTPERDISVIKSTCSSIFQKKFTSCDIAIGDGLGFSSDCNVWAVFCSCDTVQVYGMDDGKVNTENLVFKFPNPGSKSPRDGMRMIAVSGYCLAIVSESFVRAVDFSRGWAASTLTSRRLAKTYVATAVAVHTDEEVAFIATAFSYDCGRDLVVEIHKLDPDHDQLLEHSKIHLPAHKSRGSIIRLEFAKEAERLLIITDDNEVYIYYAPTKHRTQPFVISKNYGQPGVAYPKRKGFSTSALFKSPSGRPYVLLGTAPSRDRGLNEESRFEFPFTSPVADGPADCPSTLEHHLRLNLSDILSVAISAEGTVAALADSEHRLVITELGRAPTGGLCQKFNDDESHAKIKFSDHRYGFRVPPRPLSISLKWMYETESLSLLALDNQGRTIKVKYPPFRRKARTNSSLWDDG